MVLLTIFKLYRQGTANEMISQLPISWEEHIPRKINILKFCGSSEKVKQQSLIIAFTAKDHSSFVPAMFYDTAFESFPKKYLKCLISSQIFVSGLFILMTSLSKKYILTTLKSMTS